MPVSYTHLDVYKRQGLLVLIDGHPQYMGLMGHPIADAYQSMMAEKVEVLRGPASVLYGSKMCIRDRYNRRSLTGRFD